MRLVVSRANRLDGTVRVPADKSITHRAFMLSAIAVGPSTVLDPLTGEDCLSTLGCLQDLGTGVEWLSEREVRITPRPWSSPTTALDCGNSGTTMRLLAGLIASRQVEATLIGDESLSRRPMRRIAEPLRLMGATVVGETPPLQIRGANLRGIRYETPVASAQIKSAVLFAGLRAEGETWVSEPSLSRDHTERMLSGAGVTLLRDPENPLSVGVRGGSVPTSQNWQVPGDISAAAFFLVGGAIVPGSKVRLERVGVNPTRTGILDVFSEAGIEVQGIPRPTEGEPVADLEIVAPNRIRAFDIGGSLVPRLIDEIPVLAVLATQAQGWTTIRDADELRVKESDRIERMAEGLRAMGATIETFPDGMSIEGPTTLRGASLDAFGDHRLAMAFAIAGLVAEGETVIDGAESIATSFPDFERTLMLLAGP